MNTAAHDSLDRFLEDTGMPMVELARRAGLTKMQVWHLVHRRRRASFEVAFAIERATNGRVLAEDWLEVYEEAVAS